MKIQLFLSSFSYKKLMGTIVPNCKRCGSSRIRKDGWYRIYQQYKCKSCGYRFSFTSDLPRRFDSRIIEFALNLYVRVGVSLRTIANKIKKFFDVTVNHTSVYRWIKNRSIPDEKMHFGSIWHADETSIRISGEINWLWLVMDRKTRKIITHRISDDRTIEDAKKVMKQAQEKAGRPDTIITDGLWDYRRAIRKTWGWRNNPHKYTVGAAFGPNSIIERLNREIKRRIKWFGGFQNKESAEKFIKNWIHQYNTEKAT